MKRLVVAALVLGAAACVSNTDRALVKRASAAYVYAQDRYAQMCVDTPPPHRPDCLVIKGELDAWYRDLNAQLDAAQVGPLPPEARARLQTYAKTKIQ